MIAMLKRIRDAIRPEHLARSCTVSSGFVDDLEKVMPGQVYMFTVRNRTYAMLEREEFETIARKAGMRVTG